ncbi:Calcineurin-like phosphoesterase [Parelusimicrobium proximum]|uniref:metallophosphoesterase family protein n=1 Tax=Parelusimicrobium proximum TaxID=3228953 RepID=UPI003D1796CA
MKKYLLPLLLILSCHAYSAQIDRPPYSEDPTLSTVIVRWNTNKPAVSWFSYGPAPDCSLITAISPKSTQHKVVLHGLAPNKEFCYKVYFENNAGDGVQEPVEGRFRTLYSPERKVVKFLVAGNTAGENETLREMLAEKLAQHKPDFLIHTGNLVASGEDKDANAQFFTPFKDILAAAPLFVVVGEKEYGPEKESKESKSFFRTNYSRHHTMSWGKGTPNYYYFDTANVRFIFLDTNSAAGAVHAPSIAKDSAQYKWLQATLAGVGPDRWKIVLMHHAAYSTGENGSYETVRENISSLLETYNADLVIQGSDNTYERTFPVRRGEEHLNGITYITIGSSAAETFSKRAHAEDWTARFTSTAVYGVGEVVDRKLTLKIYAVADDKLIDTAVINL